MCSPCGGHLRGHFIMCALLWGTFEGSLAASFGFRSLNHRCPKCHLWRYTVILCPESCKVLIWLWQNLLQHRTFAFSRAVNVSDRFGSFWFILTSDSFLTLCPVGADRNYTLTLSDKRGRGDWRLWRETLLQTESFRLKDLGIHETAGFKLNNLLL